MKEKDAISPAAGLAAAGINSKQLTASVWHPDAAFKTPIQRPVLISHTLIVLSLDPDHNNLDSKKNKKNKKK